jgi:hypothetical protein
MQVDEYDLPTYQFTYDAYSSMKEYSWINRESYDVIKQKTYSKVECPKGTNLVFSGSVEFCYSHYPKKLSIEPIFSKIPYDFIKRKVWFGTKKDIEKGVFVKPLNDIKLFTGFVVGDKSIFDLLTDKKVSDDHLLFFSEEIQIQDEYRTWVNNGNVVDIRPYYKKTDVVVDKKVIDDCNRFIWGLYRGPFVADYGITDKGQTVLIEINDIHGTGTYGFNGPNLWKTLINH